MHRVSQEQQSLIAKISPKAAALLGKDLTLDEKTYLATEGAVDVVKAKKRNLDESEVKGLLQTLHRFTNTSDEKMRELLLNEDKAQNIIASLGNLMTVASESDAFGDQKPEVIKQLNALLQNTSAEILSKPSVLVLDGRQARIQVGEQIPISKFPVTNTGNEFEIPDVEYADGEGFVLTYSINAGKRYRFKKVFVEVIPFSNTVHPVLNSISLVYIKPLNGDKGYIVPIDHSETFTVENSLLTEVLNEIDTIYVRDKKNFLHYYFHKKCFWISFFIFRSYTFLNYGIYI